MVKHQAMSPNLYLAKPLSLISFINPKAKKMSIKGLREKPRYILSKSLV